MSWKEKKLGGVEFRKRYFDWGEFFGKVTVVGLLILMLIGMASS